MNEKELQELVQENKLDFKIIIEGNSFRINEIEVFQTDNPITEPTTRGGVYFAEMKELKVQATITDTEVSKHLSKTMLGPNKDFLDIELKAKIEGGKEICLIVNLVVSTNTAFLVIIKGLIFLFVSKRSL